MKQTQRLDEGFGDRAIRSLISVKPDDGVRFQSNWSFEKWEFRKRKLDRILASAIESPIKIEWFLKSLLRWKESRANDKGRINFDC